jgi:adenylate cyclase class IV
MEIEIKIRLASEDETSKLEAALGSPMVANEDQDNVFFDGKHREL